MWETVVKLAAQGSRKVGGMGHRESSSARLIFLDNILGCACNGGQARCIDEGKNKFGSRR